MYAGTGKIIINDRDIDDYFGLDTLKLIVRQPLTLTETTEKFDIICRVNGGGVSGQAGAIRHGLSRALLQYDESLRPALKKAGFLTRDSRMKERSPVSRQQEEHHSSQRDNYIYQTNKAQFEEKRIVLLFSYLFIFSTSSSVSFRLIRFEQIDVLYVLKLILSFGLNLP